MRKNLPGGDVQGLELVDRTGRAAYLEASETAPAALYRRNGFLPRGRVVAG